MSAQKTHAEGNGHASQDSAETMLVIEAIANAIDPFEPKAALSGLITVLATWTVENNIEPTRIVTTLISGIESAEAAKDAQEAQG
jgi:hypothetical protein